MLLAFAAAAGGDRQCEAVTREDCESFLRALIERDCKVNTQKAYHRVLDAFFNWLLSEERLETSPMKKIPRPQQAEEQIEPLSAEELARLLSQPVRDTFTGLRDRAFMALLADTGLRVSEALGVRIANADLKMRSISVVGKGSKQRTVFYGEATGRYLRDYLKRRGEAAEEELLSVNTFAEPLLRFGMTKRIRAYGLAAKITEKRLSAHTLPHTFAISWLMCGGDAFSLQRLLGHASPEMTNRYVRFASSDLAKLHRAVSPLDRLRESLPDAEPEDRIRKKRLW